jgi:putative membrane protein
MKKGLTIITIIALLLACALIASQGVGDVLKTVTKIGWGIVPVLVIHLVQVVLSGLGWYAFFSNSSYTGTMTGVVFLRWLREAINSMLPMTQIGGEVISNRLLILRGMRGGEAGATIVLDLTMEVVSQFLFTLLGLFLVMRTGYDGPVLNWIIIGLVISVPVIISFFLAQNRGLFRLFEKLMSKVVQNTSLFSKNPIDGLHDCIQLLYRRHVTLINSCSLHLLSWLAGTFEVWLIMYFIGWPVSLTEALVLESLGQAVRSAAFFIPGGLGVQEAGYLLFGLIYGLPPDQGLALSLIKRLREVLLGIPGILAWQLIEGKQAWSRKKLPDPD